MSLDDYIDIDDSDKCAICDKHVDRIDSLILPDLNFKFRPWHAECFAFFTAYNRPKVWDNYDDMARIQAEPNGFVKVVTTLLKAISAEEQHRRKCQSIQLTC